MTLQPDGLPSIASPPAVTSRTPGWRKGLERALLIVGGIALFLGLFITFAGDDHTIGIGVWSWETGEITAPWQYGLLIGGAVLVVTSLALIVARLRSNH